MQLADATVSGIESQVTAKLPQDFRAIAFGHRLRDEIANAVRKQRVSPEHLHIGGLVRKMRLTGQHNGHEPIRVLEGHQPAGAWLIAAEPSHLVEERRVLQRDCERLPPGLCDTAIEGCRIAKLRPALGQLLPERPTPAIRFGQLRGRDSSSNRGWRHRSWNRFAQRQSRRHSRRSFRVGHPANNGCLSR